MTPRRARLRRGFLRARDGATAVEFAMLAFPLFFMIFAILEIALYFTIGSVLDNAVVEMGRQIRTGRASAQGMDAAQFEAGLCSRMSVFTTDCADRTFVDVRVIPTFNAIPPDPIVNGVFMPPNGYTNGNPGSLMVVRVWYSQPLITTFLAKGLSRLKNGKILLSSTTAFRNEPPGGFGVP